MSPLPEPLRYLQPFRKQVAKLKPEEIGESMDFSLLNKLLLERIKGIPPEEGKKVLGADSDVLEEWLASPGLEDNGGMVFLQGYLMALPELVDRLLEEKAKPPERFEVQMDLPAGAKIKKQLGGGGGWKVNWLKATAFIFPSEKRCWDATLEMFRQSAKEHPPQVPVSLESVVFGKVTGLKCVTDMSVIGQQKIDYALEVPGGLAEVSLSKRGTIFDASNFEQYFHTIRIVSLQS